MKTFLACLLLLSAFAALPCAESADLAPPHYPDSDHVLNGCHVSATIYLARFSAEFPQERGQPLVVRMRNADGSVKPHTLALISWRGQWWCRDEYFGVFPIGVTAFGLWDLASLTRRVEGLYARHARSRWNEPGQLHPPTPPARLSPAQRLREVRTAAQLVPFPHAIYWAGDDPLLFFRPGPGEVAVYDPAHGTGAARCRSSNDAQIVALVAANLGYAAAAVRRDRSLDARTLVAANAP